VATLCNRGSRAAVRRKIQLIVFGTGAHAGRSDRFLDIFRVFRDVARHNLRLMKSAYELAMERLAKSDPSASAPLTPEQKSRLAEIDRVYKGKLAEREIFLKQQLEQALADQKMEEVDKIKKQIASERARLDEEREEEKEQVRKKK
jgi:hypothetical protein